MDKGYSGFLPDDEKIREKILKELLKIPDNMTSTAAGYLRDALAAPPDSSTRKSYLENLYAEIYPDYIYEVDGDYTQDFFFLLHAPQQFSSFWWDYG